MNPRSPSRSWANGIKADEILSYYDQAGFKTWDHALTGAPTVPLFRPPGGFIDLKTQEVAAEKGFKYVVTWDIDTNDWRGRTAAQITRLKV